MLSRTFLKKKKLFSFSCVLFFLSYCELELPFQFPDKSNSLVRVSRFPINFEKLTQLLGIDQIGFICKKLESAN